MNLTFLWLLWSLFSFASLADFIVELPSGEFIGLGKWDTNLGQSGEFQTYIKFDNNTSNANYIWTDGSTSLNLTFNFASDGWFGVFSDGQEVGQGFCMSHQCRYWMTIDSAFYTETLTFALDRFYKIGFKKIDDQIIRWQEILRAIGDLPIGIPNLPIVPELPIPTDPVGLLPELPGLPLDGLLPGLPVH
ncbi:MAG: hypothetical protein KC505_01410 [Myxococcales bacterium]|nr:hypothetical protein [Myxococcales bacterium]USN50308.1 MAG: hypothetical protein H6731_08575 [Myxococcales bacterium]